MYKVMFVDDEINLLETIAKLVDWESCGTCLKYKATNGQMAFELIKRNPPDIVITDIKMPGMNGIKLIENVHYLFPDVKFIVLSGYDEFEFAQTAMEYGVKHYLLKPSNEKKIQNALKNVVQEITELKEKKHFLEELNNNLSQTIPKAREQLLREFVATNKYGMLEWNHYQQVFDLPPRTKKYQLIVVTLDDSNQLQQLFFLKDRITKELAGLEIHVLSTILSDRIVILIESSKNLKQIEILKTIQEKCKASNRLSFTAAISSLGRIEDLHKLYNETLHYLNKIFYLGSGKIITPDDFYSEEDQASDLQFDHEELLFYVRSGNMEEVRRYLDEFFDKVKDTKYDVNMVRTHCIRLFMSLARYTKKDAMNDLLSEAAYFQDFNTLDQIESFLVKVFLDVTEEHYDNKKQTRHTLVREMKEYAKVNLHEESLSISKIATEVLYMNSDYLGKVFKKETGENFSNYVLKLRMRKAIEIIEYTDEITITEVAKEVGYGSNPRYFGQVFKKYTGFTPTEYKAIVS
ncbi:response regulator [Aquibacillus albus]|uniref:Two-component system response regulator YesN n=1 Tax=Aquibacillus albus TaxID=1168171 RepID=A0ABS2N5I5_9BACI|nr:response regulator [Aquibacillus albus]MBM7573396.1 two-component system response regulator YesN [Aquibacillus albus]